jgi:D-lyxose ketol-isomerase
MTITFEKENKGVEFKCLVVGDVFVEVEDPSDVYIKIDEISNEFEVVNAIDLRRGVTVCINPNAKVQFVEAELLVTM